jgi:gluconolactonase
VGGNNGVGGLTSGTDAFTTGGEAIGGRVTTDKSSAFGGISASGGTSSIDSDATVGGRGSGICPIKQYPLPDLGALATVTVSSSDSGQLEGPLWLSNQNALIFSGMTTTVSSTTVVPSTVEQLNLPSTITTVVVDSGSNGLAVDFNGRVIGGSQKLQGIVTFNLTTGFITTLVNQDANGKHFNSVNDLTVRTDGTIYFTDPDYQLSGRANETGIKGVYRYSPTKIVSLVDGQFNEPNGITLSPDEKTLYVADTPANRLRQFTVEADGSVTSKTDFATITAPDGGAVDCAGNLYWASNSEPGKIVVISKDGIILGNIPISPSDKPTNAAFGGTDRKTLFVTTSPRKIYAIALNIPGFPY